MVSHFYLIEDDLGNRVGEGVGIKAGDVAHLEPLPRQILTDETSGGWRTSATPAQAEHVEDHRLRRRSKARRHVR